MTNTEGPHDAARSAMLVAASQLPDERKTKG
jgi:hypothetical protein